MSGSAILYWEMRTGKTRTALHAYNQLVNASEVQDLIVVTVATAKSVWPQEAEQMGLSIPVYVCYGQKNKEIHPCPPDHDLPRIYVVNWEILPDWQRWFYAQTRERKRKFCLVLDEGHLYLRNPSNQRYKAAYWLRGFAERTWELTGTLYVKSGLDVLYQMRFLGKQNPMGWMDKEDFGAEFCHRRFNPFIGKGNMRDRKGGWEYTSIKNEEELMRKAPAISMLRMNDVADIPPSLQVPAWLADKKREWNFHHDDQTLEQESAELVEEKAQLTAQYVQEMPERPVVVFGWRTAFTQRVSELLEAPRIYGGTSLVDRDRLRADFQLGKVPVLVGNLRSLGLGVSLSRANHFVYGEPYWDAALYLQAQARGRSLEKKERLVHHHLLVAGSVDEYIWKVRLDRGREIERLENAAEQAQLQPDEEVG